VLPVLLGEQFLPGRVDIRADGILGHVADSGPLADGVALGFLNDDLGFPRAANSLGRFFGLSFADSSVTPPCPLFRRESVCLAR
jgi:hypothetical protein